MPISFKRPDLNMKLFFAILILDHLTKSAIVNNFQLYESVQILPFFNLVRVHNYGVSFGMLSKTVGAPILILVSLSIILLVLYYVKNDKKSVPMVTMIVAGAVGNIVDRKHYKYVVDFLDFHIGDYHWPAFNIADSAIVIGTLLLMIASYKEDKLKSDLSIKKNKGQPKSVQITKKEEKNE